MLEFWLAVEADIDGVGVSEGVIPSEVYGVVKRLKIGGESVSVRITLEKDGDIVRNSDGAAVEISFRVA